MKKLLTLLTMVALVFAFSAETQAKRFGGGGFGKSFKTTPFKQKKADPAKKEQPGQQSPTSNKRGLMGGMLGGY